MATMNQSMEKAEQALLHTYNRFPVVLERGEGVYLYDIDGKKYLDFAAGIAVFSLGYNNKKYNDALKAQIDKLIHTSNLFYNTPAIEAATKIVNATGLDKVFFTNSGTEAIEGAMKAALELLPTITAQQLIDAQPQQLGQRQEQIDIGRGLPRFPAGDGLRCDVQGGGQGVLSQAFFGSVLADDLADRLFGDVLGLLLLFEIGMIRVVFFHIALLGWVR